MGEIELVLALMVAVTALVLLSHRLGVPYPLLLVVGGLLLSVIPGLPHIQLEPDLVLLLFLPPILFSAAYFTSLRDIKANAYPIGMLAVGLVVATAAGVAVVVRALLPDIGWAAAFALGAIVAPPDAAAATAVAQRLGVPRRLVTIIEGESLVNDATALVLYRMAVAAAVTGAFSLSGSILQFVLVALGGIVIGLVVGWIVIWVWNRIEDSLVEIMISLIAPFAAYLPAELLQVSGVLAAVSAGVYVGRHAARASTSESRLQGRAVWEMLIFFINGLLFILIGLQLSAILARLSPGSLRSGVVVAALVSFTAILIRAAWVFPAAYLPRLLSSSYQQRDPAPPWQHVVVLSWAGMRGAISLAAALALPQTLADGSPFPQRDLLVFIAFGVILVTLVGQGLTLPLLIRRLGVGDDGSADHEEFHAREIAAEAAVDRIQQLAKEWPEHRELVETLRGQYAHRASHVGEHNHAADGAVVLEPSDREMLEHRAIRHEVIEAEREAVIALRDRGAISDDVLRRVERDLDLEELRMEA